MKHLKDVIYFALGIVVAMLSIKLIFNDDLETSDFELAFVLIGTYVYRKLIFSNGFSILKLAIGSLGILLTLILLTFVFKMDIATYSIIIFAIFFAETVSKDRKKSKSSNY